MIEQHLEEEDFNRFLETTSKYVRKVNDSKKPFNPILFWSIVLLIVFYLLFLKPTGIDHGIFILGFITGNLILIGVMRQQHSLLLPKKGGPVLGKHEISLLDRGIEIKQGGYVSVTEWDCILNAYETKDSLYLFLDHCIGHILKKKAMESDPDFLLRLKDYLSGKW